VLISSPAFSDLERNSLHASRRQRQDFIDLTQAIMVGVTPQAQHAKDGIAAVDPTVRIAAVWREVEPAERLESMCRRRTERCP
jgi:hypothetical protein